MECDVCVLKIKLEESQNTNRFLRETLREVRVSHREALRRIKQYRRREEWYKRQLDAQGGEVIVENFMGLGDLRRYNAK